MNNNQNNKGNQKKKNYFLKCTIGICCMDIKVYFLKNRKNYY